MKKALNIVKLRGVSINEQLRFEEILLRRSNENWYIYEMFDCKVKNLIISYHYLISNHNDDFFDPNAFLSVLHRFIFNAKSLHVAVVLGYSGKVRDLVNIEAVSR
jgi:hypothetical protein